MGVNWLDVSDLSFNSLLLLEAVQLSWLPGWLPEESLGVALRGNPVVAWYLRHKCPEIGDWVEEVLSRSPEQTTPEAVRRAELKILSSLNDLLTYVVDPAVYDAQPFLGWDDAELTNLVDFYDKTVIDVGAGTGRLTMVAATTAVAVFAVEPVANLRRYIKERAAARRLPHVYPVDGLITAVPFPDNFADVTMGGHVFGDDPAAEYQELVRVTNPGGMVILCPGNNDQDNETHRFLLDRHFAWTRFEEPVDGIKRKYWKTI